MEKQAIPLSSINKNEGAFTGIQVRELPLQRISFAHESIGEYHHARSLKIDA